MHPIRTYAFRIIGLIILSGLLIYLGLLLTFQYVRGNLQENRSESIQFVTTEVHDQIIELNLMDNLIKLQEFLVDYAASNEVSVYKIHVLSKNYDVIASTDLKYVRKTFFDESYRQVRERLRSNIVSKKIDDESIVECAYPIKASMFTSAKPHQSSGSELLGILLVWKKTSPISEILYSDQSNIAITIVFVIILGIVVWIGIYTNKFFSNLGSISGTAKKIALGNYQERIPFDKNSEFGLLAESFNQIADSLENRIRETSIINRKLEESNIEQEKQVRILSQMAGGVAHEVRNPLGGIRGFAELLKSEIDPRDEEKIKYIQYILDEVKTLEALVQNVLDFARPRRPNISMANMEIILDAVSNAVQSRIDSIAAAGKKIDMNIVVTPEANEFDADPNQIKQVLLNLALNACDAMSDTGGLLKITVEKGKGAEGKSEQDAGRRDIHRKDYVLITISDTGCGMTKEVLDNLFSPFYTTKASGTGLGLSICQKIIENHGGYMKVSSEPGRGTSFFVVLPATAE